MTKFNHTTHFGTEYWQPVLREEFPVWQGSLQEKADEEITTLHYHDHLELGYCYEGSGIFVIEDQVCRFQAGDASLIHRGRMHFSQSMKGTTSKWRFLLLDADALAKEFQPDIQAMLDTWQTTGTSEIVAHGSQAKIAGVIREIIEETVAQAGHYQSLVKFKLGELLMQCMRTAQEAEPKLRHFDDKAFRRILPAIQYILQNYAGQIKVDTLAALCNLSPTQFRRLFLAAMDMSPQTYLISIRLSHADQLLQSAQLKIVDIAEKVGFGTLSSFNRAYQLTRHHSPKQARGKAMNLKP